MDKLVPLFLIFKNTAVAVGKWIEIHSGFVSAAATVVIAAFTLTLWCATRKLGKISQEQSRDLKESIAVAQRAAKAAEDSANALPAIERAYLLVKVVMDKAHDVYVGDNDEPAPNRSVEVIVTNKGKTAALLTGITYTIDIFENDHQVNEYLSEVIANYSAIPSGTDLINNKRTLPTLFYMSHSKWKELMSKSRTLICLGCIHYEDVFGKPHRTVFCWNYETYVGFHADKDPKRNERT